MIGKQWMRLLREGLLKLYKAYPVLVDFTVYYMATEKGKPMARGAAVRSMHELEFLPWPEDNCIVVSEEPYMMAHHNDGTWGILLTFAVHSVAWLTQTQGVKLHGDSRATGEKIITYQIAMTGQRQIIWGEGVAFMGMFRGEFSLSSLPEEMKEMREILSETGVTAFSAEYLNFFEACVPRVDGHVWYGCSEGKSPGLEPGIILLSALANIATPCHYRVLAQSQGFGSKAVRRAIQAKPFICIVAFDRLYTMQPTNGDGHPKTPHSRCGHIRHLWKEAGINRFALPQEPENRIRLVADRHVRRIYVHPTWVGRREYSADGIDYKIEGGETELPPLS